MDRGVVTRPGRFSAVRLPQAGVEQAAAARRSPCRVRPGEASTTGVSGGTGQLRPQPGQRLADDAGQEAGRRRVRQAQPDSHGHQPDRAAPGVTLAAVVGDQLLADELAPDAVTRLRPGAGSSPTATAGSPPQAAGRAGSALTEDRDRAGEDQHRRRRLPPGMFQHRAGPVHVAPAGPGRSRPRPRRSPPRPGER